MEHMKHMKHMPPLKIPRQALVAGGVVGSQAGRHHEGPSSSRDMERCADGPRPLQPANWDVEYNFRGINHRVQLTDAPGPTISVNRQGEPRA
jgi:hypothetical protein